jgi:thiosulfate/3-mercaptopyruvate sulfurtransferase
MTGLPLDSPLVSTQWLADHLGSPDLLVVDATVRSTVDAAGRRGYVSGHETYLLQGHVPGAVFADLVDEFSDPAGRYPFTRPDAERFASAASALGVGPDTTVVVYDDALGQWASRLWWLLGAFGHDAVAVLDGGLGAWRAQGRPLDVGHVDPAPATFVAHERPERWASRDEVAAVSDGRQPGSLVCGVPAAEFAGTEGPRARLGHIPGSISAPAGRLVHRESGAFLEAPALRELLAPALGTTRVIAYCHAGIAAAADALALTVAGHTDVAIYDGSLSEWSADADAPLATIDDAVRA